MADYEIIETDVLVIGTGAAGIVAGIKAHQEGTEVMLTTSGALGMDGAATWMAGGGLQCALYPPDSVEVHASDTIRTGLYLSNQELVHTLLREAPGCILDLERWGERFYKKSGRFVQYPSPGHTHARCFQLEKDKGVSVFGVEHHKILPHAIRARGIPVLDDFLVIDLICSSEGRVVGAVGIDLREGAVKVIRSQVTVLATGGYAACYKEYLTGPSATGWGHGMAYRAGAEFMDMEFVDFYPYVAVWPKLSMGGEWAAMLRYALSGKFYNKMGFEFWESYRKRGLTRPQAIFKEVEAGRGSPHGGVYLAFNHLPVNLIADYAGTQQGNNWFRELMEIGFDLRRDAAEVYISVMSTLGGCKVGVDCRTNVPGLYVAGELASGFDGAHTLAGNMMTFCFTSGSVAGRKAAEEAKNTPRTGIDTQCLLELENKAFAPLGRVHGVRPFEIKRRIRDIMWDYANVAGRTGEGLEIALREIESIRDEKLPLVYASAKNIRFNLEWAECFEVENMLTVAEMTLRAALARTESRGLHFREDFPRIDPDFTKTIVLRKAKGEMSIGTEPVAFPYLKPGGKQE